MTAGQRALYAGAGGEMTRTTEQNSRRNIDAGLKAGRVNSHCTYGSTA